MSDERLTVDDLRGMLDDEIVAHIDALEAEVAALRAAGDRMAEQIESHGPYDMLEAADAWRALDGPGDRREGAR